MAAMGDSGFDPFGFAGSIEGKRLNRVEGIEVVAFSCANSASKCILQAEIESLNFEVSPLGRDVDSEWGLNTLFSSDV